MTLLVSTLLVATLSSSGSIPQDGNAQSGTNAVIDCGLGKVKCKDPVLEIGSLLSGAPWIEVATPAGRIWRAAREAKREYRPFTEADVTPEMRVDEVEIRAHQNRAKVDDLMVVRRIVIRPVGSTAVIQPASETELPFEVSNLAGARLSGVDRVARFRLSDLPPGNLEVLVVYTKIQRDYTSEEKLIIKGESRNALRPCC